MSESSITPHNIIDAIVVGLRFHHDRCLKIQCWSYAISAIPGIVVGRTNHDEGVIVTLVVRHVHMLCYYLSYLLSY